MRIWSLHPKYLDAKGLVALWRESLLAKHVLEGKTRGYKNHPQLLRFKKTADPVQSINQYLAAVHKEAVRRGYRFNKDKIDWKYKSELLNVTKGQISFEMNHLLNKLKIRDKKRNLELMQIEYPETHPFFKLVEGDIEYWEITKE
ncbi:MAG: hypothetical protein ISR55_03060 [Bacteroidetes bacterium]|nr:hypothetical protein [Bacteroidota bacterium]